MQLEALQDRLHFSQLQRLAAASGSDAAAEGSRAAAAAAATRGEVQQLQQ